MSTFAAVTEFLEPVVVIRRRRREDEPDHPVRPALSFSNMDHQRHALSNGAISMEQFLEEAEGSLSGVRCNGLLENNILVTHFLAGYKHKVDEDVVTPLYVHSTSDAFVGPSPLSRDIDSFAYVGDHVPIRAPFGLVFRPRYDLSYKSNRGVTVVEKIVH
ncbi:hypothetical protein CU097_005143, partial [Rhizopus azygosporus]